ncbi:MAG: phosphate uptake regulator PhoU [Anaerolineae bacterium]|jgi:phosphate uptake regulator
MAQPIRERQQQLQDELVSQGSLVEELLIGAVDLLKQNSLDTLERLGEETRLVHKKRLAIEMGCLSLIATRRPRDEELRQLVAMVEIAAELEHIADHASRVARVNYLVADHQLRRPLASIQRMASKVQSPMNQVVEAFLLGDLALVEVALLESQGVNALYGQAYGELLEVMKSNPRIANQAIYLSRAAYNLKRAAERVAGICDWVSYFITGTMGTLTPLRGRAMPETELAHDESMIV